MSMLFSYRNKLLEQAIEFINSKWTIYNYFFGGVDFYTFKIEFEFIDLYLFLGIPGVIYYIFIVMLFISQKHALVKKLIFITFLTSFLSGGLILNVTAIILFYIAIEKVMISDYGYQIS